MILELARLDVYQPVNSGKQTRMTHLADEFNLQWYVPDFFCIKAKRDGSMIFVPLANVKSWALADKSKENDLQIEYKVDADLGVVTVPAVAQNRQELLEARAEAGRDVVRESKRAKRNPNHVEIVFDEKKELLKFNEHETDEETDEELEKKPSELSDDFDL